jgi:formylglycine-generating enzyme
MPLPPEPDPGDSVPPLLAGEPHAPRWPGVAAKLSGGLLLAAAAGAGAAFYARSISSPPPPPRAAAIAPPTPSSPVAAPATTLTMDDDDRDPPTLPEQRARLFAIVRRELRLRDDQMDRLFALFAASPVLGQGNPAVSRHPMSRSECRRIRREAGVTPADDPRCGAPGMVPLYDPERGQTAADAPVCIDQLEFPDVPCEYPVVQVRASEAAAICLAVGKRLCNAHEWEGACAGALRDPSVEYEWGRRRIEASWFHDYTREKRWAYGPERDLPRCATGSFITPGCPGGSWNKCGSNTYPAGAFPACQSAFGVFDQHGNAAEHMNLPVVP